METIKNIKCTNNFKNAFEKYRHLKLDTLKERDSVKMAKGRIITKAQP